MSLGKLSVRTASAGDLEALIALYQHLSPGDQKPSIDVAEERFRTLETLTGSAVMIGLYEGAVVSSCTLVVIPNLTRGGRPYGLIENVVTDGRYRGKGFGKSVLRAAVDLAWDADCYKVMLMTGSKRPETLKFYEDVGFEQSKTGFQMRRIAVRED